MLRENWKKNKGVSLKFTSLLYDERFTDFVFTDFVIRYHSCVYLLLNANFVFFLISASYFINAENEVIFIKMNILDKTRVICLLHRRVLRDVLEDVRRNHLLVTKK